MGNTWRFLGMMIVLLTVAGLAGPLFAVGENGTIVSRAEEPTSPVKPEEPAATGPGNAAKEVEPSDRSKIIVIDPGHPSEISGGANANGIKEVDVNWDIGQALATALAKKPGVKVLVNRKEKMQMMPNQARAEFANRAQAALCVRLHCDSSGPTKSGFTIYYPDTQGTIRGKTGPSQAVISKSRIAAHSLHKGMVKRLAGVLADGGVKTDRQTSVGAKNGGALIGSIFSEVPALVVEMIYISHPKDAAFITSAEGRQAMVEALVAGVVEDLEHLTPKK
jgi:N-acetylmuramoyl-L-alanine amidase